MEKTKKHKKHRDGSQDPMKGQVSVDVPTATGVSMDFAKNMKSVAVELKRMSLENSQAPNMSQGHRMPPASQGPEGQMVKHAMPQNTFERDLQLQRPEHTQQQIHTQKPTQMQQLREQEHEMLRVSGMPNPDHQMLQQYSRPHQTNLEAESLQVSPASPMSALKGQVKYHHQTPQNKQQQHKVMQQIQGKTPPSSIRASPYNTLQGFTDVGVVLDGMTCPSCGNIKGMERLDLSQLRDAAEELRAQLADLSLQFAQEQNREAAECRRLRGLLEGDARYAHELHASRNEMSRGNSAEVRDLQSELERLKWQFQSQVVELRDELSAEKMQSDKLREKLQLQEMRRGR